MVTPPSCPGLTVDILVDGQPLQEYDDIDEGPVPPNTVTKYIEARSGANFAVRARFNDGFPFPAGQLRFKTTLDRKYPKRTIIDADDLFNYEGTVNAGCVSRIGHGTDALCKYRFLALDLVDVISHETGEELMGDIQSMGIITAELQFIHVKGPGEPRTKGPGNNTFNEIPEKAFKGHPKSHYGGLDAPVPEEITWVRTEEIGHGPFFTVNFKYRSLDVLQALHVIPREPTPLPLEERPEEDLSPDELRQVLRLYKNREVASLKIKKEASSKRSQSDAAETVGENDVVIVEGPSRKRRRAGNSEVIVLD